MTLDYFLFFVGFALLIYSAHYLVTGASILASKLGISALAIGLTIVAFGTSAPELVVNILASLRGSTDLAIGNVLGSNIANILLILGITAVIYPLRVSKGTVWKEIPLALLAIMVVSVMANDALVEGATFSAITRTDGLVLIGFLIIFFYYVIGISKAKGVDEPPAHSHEYSLPVSLLMVLGGTAGLALGGSWVVEGAVAFADAFGVSEAVVGLTVVAIGTSLPELATSVVAALKKQADIAVGNVVGSNIFNIFWILGASSIITPLPFSPELMRDVYMVLFATLLLLIYMFTGTKHVLERSQGAGFIAIYIFYLAYLTLQI